MRVNQDQIYTNEYDISRQKIEAMNVSIQFLLIGSNQVKGSEKLDKWCSKIRMRSTLSTIRSTSFKPLFSVSSEIERKRRERQRIARRKWIGELCNIGLKVVLIAFV